MQTSISVSNPFSIRISSDSKLAGLNEIFPKGIPCSFAEPSICLGGMQCFEVIWQQPGCWAGDIEYVLFQPGCPFEVARLWLDRKILAIPADCAEVDL